MRRRATRAALVGAATAAVLTVPLAGTGTAGGGCHAELTQGTGQKVEMSKACFRPSILRVDPGTEVTFVNQDPIGHNIWANGWGYFDDMRPGDTYTADFEEPGIYPFACAYHPGMIGAVVVGSGLGPGSGETVSVASDAPAAQARPAATEQGQGPIGWIAGGAIGVALGAGLGILLRRRSRAGR
jgi:plastocyanin